MIVKCDQCQARFKIPDEKVTEKGVKVRCTKCQHTFRVRRQGSEAVNEPSGSVAVSRAPAAPAQPAADPFAAFGAAPPVASEHATRPMTLGQGLGNGLFGAPSGDLGGDGEGDPDPFEQKTRVARVPTELFRDDPEPPTRPNLASARAPQVAPADPFAPPANLGDDPFALPPARELTQPPQAPSAKPPPPVAFDDPFALPPEPKAPGSRPGSKPGTPPSALDDPFALPPEPKGAGSRPGSRPGSKPQSAPAFGHDPFAQGASPDPFGADDSDLGGPSGLELDSAKAEARAMFDLPSRPSTPPSSPPLAAPSTFEAEPTVSTTTPRSGSVAIGRIAKPAGRPEQAGVPDAAPAPGAARRMSGWVVNLTVAAALLLGVAAIGNVYLNEGSFDPSTLTLERVKSMFAAHGGALAVRDISNGLYETRGAKPVFFVRGEVENRGEVPVKVRVRAEILDGKDLLRAAEGFAGEVPSPEDLHAVTNAQSLEALTAKLREKATEIAPGARAPFLITFYEYPPDLSRFRLRVTPHVGSAVEKSSAR